MLKHELGKEAAIKPVASLQGVDSRILGDDSQIQRRVSQGNIEINQKRGLTGLLSQRNGKIASQRGYAGAPLGAHECQQSTACLLLIRTGGANRRPPRCCTYQRLRRSEEHTSELQSLRHL